MSVHDILLFRREMALATNVSPYALTCHCSHRQLHTLAKGRQQRSRTVTISCSKRDNDPCDRHLNRRNMLLSSGAALALAPLGPALALEGPGASFITYTDPLDGFSLKVPSDWVFGEGSLPGNSSFTGASGSRRTLVWFPEGANARDINVTLVITNVSVEFTKLGSFGTPYQFASSLVNSQDRSYLLRGPQWARGKDPIQVAKLVDAAEVSNRYYVEYTLQKLPEPQRHLYSVLTLGFNGMYNRLYTITAQTLEDDLAKYEPTLLAMVKSLTVQAQRM